MLVTRELKKEKNRFEIFSKEEIDQLNKIKNNYLKAMILEMVEIMNHGVNCEQGSWYQKVTSAIESRSKNMDSKEKKDIKESLNHYLEIANQLQKPKEGGFETLHFKRLNKGITRFHQVYNNFWKATYEIAFHAFVVKLSKVVEEDMDDKAKGYLYALLQFQEDDLFDAFLEEKKLQNFQKKITDAVQIILKKSSLKTTFLLGAMDKSIGNALYNNLLEKIYHLKALQALFEESPVYARYIHIRPTMLIQYLQFIDYCLLKCKDAFLTGHLLILKNKKENTFLKNQAISLLKEKRQEILLMLTFHEKLHVSYSKDDFIEVLHKILKNISVAQFPTQIFFEFEEKANVRLFEYDTEDKEAPKQISIEERGHWRKNYLEKERIYSIKPIEILRYEEESPKYKEEMIPYQDVELVMDLKACSIRLPSVLIFPFTEAFNKRQDFSILVDFFITKQNTRRNICKINTYQRLINFLSRQAEQKGLIQFLPVNEKTLQYLKDLLSVLYIFSEPFCHEIVLAKEFQEKSLHLKSLFQTYIDTLHQTKDIFDRKAKKILFYWIERLEHELQKTAFREQFSEILRVMGDAVSMVEDFSLRMKWQNLSIDSQIKEVNIRLR